MFWFLGFLCRVVAKAYALQSYVIMPHSMFRILELCEAPCESRVAMVDHLIFYLSFCGLKNDFSKSNVLLSVYFEARCITIYLYFFLVALWTAILHAAWCLFEPSSLPISGQWMAFRTEYPFPCPLTHIQLCRLGEEALCSVCIGLLFCENSVFIDQVSVLLRKESLVSVRQSSILSKQNTQALLKTSFIVKYILSSHDLYY